MSIEKAIAENTAAVEKLTAAILATTKLAPTGATEGKPAGKPAGNRTDDQRCQDTHEQAA